jgi:hypothetical protein
VTWLIRKIEPPRLHEPRDVDGRRMCRTYRTGDAWYATLDLASGTWHTYPELGSQIRLSMDYRRDHAHRPPIVVVLPADHLWCIDSAASDTTRGWKILGGIEDEDPPLWVAPSINIRLGHDEESRRRFFHWGYHGFIEHGIIGRDLDGRVYDGHGRALASLDR